MQITLKLYAMLTDYLPSDAVKNEARLDYSDASPVSVEQVIKQFNMPERLVHLVLLNGVYLEPEQLATTVLKDNDVLAIWPPVAGG